jgi:hypothetical protein
MRPDLAWCGYGQTNYSTEPQCKAGDNWELTLKRQVNGADCYRLPLQAHAIAADLHTQGIRSIDLVFGTHDGWKTIDAYDLSYDRSRVSPFGREVVIELRRRESARR